MSEPSERLKKLQSMLEKTPNDAFLLYSIGMEHKKADASAAAVEWFDRALAADAKYCYAYYQKGQAYESDGEVEAAKKAYREGIEAAIKYGDAHARSELEGALSMLD